MMFSDTYIYCENAAICLFSPPKSGYGSKIELRSKECIDAVLQPLKDHVIIKINGSLTCENIFRTVVNMAVNTHSVHLSL